MRLYAYSFGSKCAVLPQLQPWFPYLMYFVAALLDCHMHFLQKMSHPLLKTVTYGYFSYAAFLWYISHTEKVVKNDNHRFPRSNAGISGCTPTSSQLQGQKNWTLQWLAGWVWCSARHLVGWVAVFFLRGNAPKTGSNHSSIDGFSSFLLPLFNTLKTSHSGILLS